MNKKASEERILDLFRLIFLVVVFFSIVFLARAFIIQKIDIFEVESKLLIHRIALSNEINYVDKDLSRTYIGIVDLQKFTSGDIQNNLLNLIYYGKINSVASAKLTLKNLDDKQEYEVFYNKYLYDEKKVLVESKLIGAGAPKRFDADFYVLIKDKEKLKRGVLNIDAILPNR